MTPIQSPKNRQGFTLMEVLVVVAIILVIAAIAFPVITTVQQRANKVYAMKVLKDLGAALPTYVMDHDGDLPQEDAKGTDNWGSAADPQNAKAWYNALPKQMGRRTVADYSANPRDYYTKDNLLYLPGASYPESDKKLVKPLFAIAINTKLQRKGDDGKKGAVKLTQIAVPSKTAIFLEQGLPSEKTTSLAIQPNKNFDGSPKGSAKSFPGRYGGKGLIIFIDSHIAEFEPKSLLTDTGSFPFPPEDIVWCRTPEEDPNK